MSRRAGHRAVQRRLPPMSREKVAASRPGLRTNFLVLKIRNSAQYYLDQNGNGMVEFWLRQNLSRRCFLTPQAPADLYVTR